MSTQKLRISLFILVLMLAIAPAAFAQDETPEPPGDTVIVVEEAPTEEAAPTEEVGITVDSVLALMLFLLSFFPVLGGSIGAVISTIVDIIKSTGLLKDGWAALPLLLLNFAAIVVIYAVYGLKPGEAIPAELDSTLRQLVTLIGVALTFIGSLGGGKAFHDLVLSKLSPRFSHSANLPKSYTSAGASASRTTI